jgi:hypothetical protein
MRFKRGLTGLALAAAMISFASAACAGATPSVLYDNPYSAAADNGSCLWSSTCAADQLAPVFLAAQSFNLGSSASLTSASFIELDLGDNAPTSVGWDIYSENASTGLPGSLIASGVSDVTTTTSLGTDSSGGYSITQGAFSLPSVTVAGGSYYLAIQGVSPSFDDFLAQGLSSTGAAQSTDGGLTFTAGYGLAEDTVTSLAVSISGATTVSAAPEPSAWALMILGVGVVGALLRLNRRHGAMGRVQDVGRADAVG